MSASVALCLAVSVLMIAQPVALLATDMTPDKRAVPCWQGALIMLL